MFRALPEPGVCIDENGERLGLSRAVRPGQYIEFVPSEPPYITERDDFGLGLNRSYFHGLHFPLLTFPLPPYQ